MGSLYEQSTYIPRHCQTRRAKARRSATVQSQPWGGALPRPTHSESAKPNGTIRSFCSEGSLTPTVSVGNKASNTRSGKNPAPTKRCWPDSSAEQADAQASAYSFCSEGALPPTETHKDKPQGRRQYQQFGTATAVSTSLTVWAKRQGRGKIPGPKNGKGHPSH